MPQQSPLLNLPDARSDRWLLLSNFLSGWYRLSSQPSDGYNEEELEQCESRLGLTLPATFREWYQLVGRRHDVWCIQDRLLPPHQIFCKDNVLQFCIENQGVTSWGVRIEDLSQDDPPVLVRDEKEDWVEQSSTISEFVLHSAAFYIQFGQKPAQIHGLAHTTFIESLTSTFPALGFPEFVWTRTRILGFYDLLVAIDGTDHVTASALTETALAPFRSLIADGNFDILHESPGEGS